MNEIDHKLMDQIHDCGYYAFHGHKKNKRQEKVLEILLKNNGMKQKDLLHILEIQPGSLSELITKLESKNYIERKKDNHDKRIVYLYITNEGKEYIEKYLENVEEVEYFQSLNNEEKKELNLLLDKLLREWKKDYGPNTRKDIYKK